MKNAKLLIALIAGFSMALIFGFTKDSGVKKARKHMSIAWGLDGGYLISSTGITKELKMEPGRKDKTNNKACAELIIAMNELEEQGYELVSTEHKTITSIPLSANGASNESYDIFLFREKEAK